MNKIYRAGIIIFLGFLFGACANRGGGPQGGPSDMYPPKVEGSVPENGVQNFIQREIIVEFDEYVQLDKPTEKIIISPPQIISPAIRASGKRVTVSFSDSLVGGTTYSIDFTDAIVDLNERNPLDGYVFSFSTGTGIDTMQIGGTIIDAENLNPLAGYIVGIYADLNDTAFTSKPPLRIGRTDEKGYFSIKNIKADRYHIFALKDQNNDYFYNDPNEAIAFIDTLIVPSVVQEQKTDTIHRHHHHDKNEEKHSKKDEFADTLATDTLLPDSIHTYMVDRFLPDSLILRAFTQKFTKQAFLKPERKVPHKVTFYFLSENKEKPKIRLLNEEKDTNNIYQYSEKLDTVSIWLGDSALWNADSLQFELQYQKTDSLGKLVTQTDSVFANFRHPKKTAKKRNDREKPKTEFLSVKHNVQGMMELNNPLTLTFVEPVVSIDTSKTHLRKKMKSDSIWVDIPVVLAAADNVGLCYEMTQEWDPESEYHFQIDSTAVVNILGLHNNKLETKFQVKGLEQYAALIVNLLNFNGKEVVQLLNAQDKVIRQYPAEAEGTIFDFLAPGEYYLRLFIDENGNEQWDTGEYSEHRQPEEVFYFETKLQLRANWDVEQEWNYRQTPLLKQKPVALMGTTQQQQSERR